MQTYLLLETGNTNIKVGICTANEMLASYNLPTQSDLTADLLGMRILQILQHSNIPTHNIKGCIGASVVPGVNSVLRGACLRFLKKPLRLVGEEITLPIQNKYETQHEVGADRLLASYAARVLYPDAEAIISIDYGTATTFDCVKGNSYLGGLICPGMLSSARSLASNTAKLPQITFELKASEPIIAKNTATSLTHGFIFGFAALSEGVVARLKKVLPNPVTVVATGGHAQTLSKVATCFDHVRPDLLLEGLRLALPLLPHGEED